MVQHLRITIGPFLWHPVWTQMEDLIPQDENSSIYSFGFEQKHILDPELESQEISKFCYLKIGYRAIRRTIKIKPRHKQASSSVGL